MVATVENLGNLIDPLGARGGVPGRGAEVDVSEASGDLVDRDAGLEQVGGPVGPERVRVPEPLRHSSGDTGAAHQPMHRDGREREGLLVAVAAEAHEERLIVEQRDGPRQRVDFQPGIERLLDGLGNGNLPLTATLAANVQAVMPGVGARTAQVPATQTAQPAERSPQSPRTRRSA
jgi:hypothetical protein